MPYRSSTAVSIPRVAPPCVDPLSGPAGWTRTARAPRSVAQKCQGVPGKPTAKLAPMAVIAKETAQPSVQARPNARWWTRPFAIGALVYVAITVTHGILSLIACHGHFVYAVDDAYIALAMAKNLALHGVWGVTRYGFSGSSSSILFPLLTAAIFRVIGVSVYVPLLISWLAGLASILVAARILARFVSRTWQTLLLVLLVVCAPLFVIGVIGMEHTLHLLFTLLFLEIFL